MLMAGDPGEKRGKGVAGGILVAVLAGKPLQLLTEMTETEGVRNTNTMELMILIH
jgi:predicted CDP-diglyceride synthetase/phosphatidate cytidylyltransferase